MYYRCSLPMLLYTFRSPPHIFTGIALGILLTVVFRKTGVWAAIRRFLKNLLP